MAKGAGNTELRLARANAKLKGENDDLNALVKAKARDLREVKKESEATNWMEVAFSAGTTALGAAGNGGVRAMGWTEGRENIEPVGALAVALVGWKFEMPYLIDAATGFASRRISELAEEKVRDTRNALTERAERRQTEEADKAAERQRQTAQQAA